jgi:hypothetical protein
MLLNTKLKVAPRTVRILHTPESFILGTEDIHVGYLDSYMFYSSESEADADKEIVLLGICVIQLRHVYTEQAHKHCMQVA